MEEVYVIDIGRRTIGLALAAAVIASAPSASAQRRNDRIEGQRYTALRSLATYVENGAEFTLEEARVAVGNSRNARERSLMTALRNFQAQAQRFRNRVDQYEARPWRVETELTRLRNAARNVNTQLRRVPALSGVTEDWNQVIQDINDMTRITSGSEVAVRRPTDRWERRDRGDRYRNDRVGDSRVGNDTLRGQRLDDFRRLSRELDVAARQAFNRARTQRADNSGAGVQLLRDLETFAREAAQVRTQADAREVRPRDINPLVARLLEDARRADTSMRNARVYTSVWNEWTDVIRKLEQMMPLVR
jgi:hypothetical protein